MLIFWFGCLVWVFFGGRDLGGRVVVGYDRLGFLFFYFLSVMRNVSVVGLAGWLCL